MSTAVVLRSHGDASVLQLTSAAEPVLGAGQALVEVEAAGVAYADVLMRKGIYPESPRLPFTPGYDVVGRVGAVGPGVSSVAVGDRVAALTVTGGYSTHALADADLCVPVPDDVPAAQAVALVLNYVTARQMLHRVAGVRPGDAVLVHGAAGGVGTALVELAVAAGITVYGSASGARTAAVSARGGIALDRREVDVVDEVLRRHPGGVAATFDAIGGPHLHTSRRATRTDGVVVSYGISFAADAGAGRTAALVRHGAALARARVTPGARVRLYVIAGRRGHATRRPEHFREDLALLLDQLRAGLLQPEVTVLPLAQVARAHELLEAGATTGKTVLATGVAA